MTADLDPRTHAKRRDPDTSHTAAAMLGDQHTIMARLLALYLDADRTDEQAADVLGLTQEQVNKRASDLRNEGWITDTGDRIIGRTGRPRMLCTITRAGVVQLARWSR